MKFKDTIDMVNLDLSLRNHIVLHPVLNIPNEINPKRIDELKKLHFNRIKISDAIYVIDRENYIGESVQREIEYAIEMHIPIIFHSKLNTYSGFSL